MDTTLFPDYPYAQCDADDERTIIGLQQAEAWAEAAALENGTVGYLQAEEEAWDLLNELTDEWGLVDPGGNFVYRIVYANSTDDLRKVIHDLRQVLLQAMKESARIAVMNSFFNPGSIEQML